MDRAKPAIPGLAETSEFYFVPSSGAQIGLHLRPPAPWSALQHMAMMEQAIE
jgi:hypothetical protein